ncbi:MAG TPA: tripartite tricarboxylate transporter substrate binding protein [Burkholderiales bacterium]|nr:tripartite tricarboxylate transporter substrate binding protein [Burkholderiales bacterium]
MSRLRAVCISALAVLSCAIGSAHAQDAQYPSKPVRFIIGFAPGGFTDLMARLLAGHLSDMWKQQVIADNRPGGGSIIATEAVAKAPADGYTLLMMTDNHVTNPSLFKSLPYDSIRDFAPITLAAYAPFMLLIHPSLPAKSVKELLALAKARPGEITFGSGGIGGPGHLAGEMLNSLGGVKMVHVPYKGGALAMVDLQAGHVQLYFGNVPTSLPHVKAGRVKALAVTTAKRAAVAPEYPTVAEAGVPGFELSPFYGVLMRAGTPPEILAKVNRDIVSILRNPATQQRIASLGGDPVGNSQAEFVAFLKNEAVRWGKLVRDSGAKPQ